MVRVPYFLGAFRVHAEQKTSQVIHTTGADEMRRVRARFHGRRADDFATIEKFARHGPVSAARLTARLSRSGSAGELDRPRGFRFCKAGFRRPPAMLLSIVVPVYKEEKNIPEFLRRMRPLLAPITGDYELIFSLDPSPDRTEEVILEERRPTNASSC
jgi:hypothetical protein